VILIFIKNPAAFPSRQVDNPGVDHGCSGTLENQKEVLCTMSKKWWRKVTNKKNRRLTNQLIGSLLLGSLLLQFSLF
jgi:hypothetical protein